MAMVKWEVVMSHNRILNMQIKTKDKKTLDTINLWIDASYNPNRW